MSGLIAPTLPAALYQGSVNTWECDDGGHLNVRFHVERAMIGLAHIANALQIPHAFTAQAGATLMVREAHIRFLKEALPGEPLSMHGGVTSIGESDATFCLDMRNGAGAPASCFNLRVAHVETRGLRAFPWSQRARAAAATFACDTPAHGKPRSLDAGKAPGEASRALAIERGATRIGGTVAMLDQCDAFGRLRAEHVIGSVSDSVPNLLAKWRQEAASAAGAATPAGAVVEARIVFRKLPRVGELIEIYSGLAEVGEKTMRLVHWLVDPESGGAWATIEVIALTFDTATRKTITPSAEVRASMQKRVVALAL